MKVSFQRNILHILRATEKKQEATEQMKEA